MTADDATAGDVTPDDVTADDDLLRRLTDAIRAADLDVEELVASAWADAREEVHAVLKRSMTGHLLDLALQVLREPAASDATRAPRRGRARSPVPHLTDGDTAHDVRSQATYVFGIGRDDLTVPGDELPRLPDAGPPRALDHGALRAIVCDVDAAVFDAMHEPQLESLERLATVARAHDTILAALAAAGPVVPLRPGTVVSGDDEVRELLTTQAPALHAELERIDGYAEWIVTVHLLSTPDAAHDGPSVRPPADGEDAPSAGADASPRDTKETVARAIHEELAAIAADAVRVESRPLADRPPLLYGAYLVRDAVVTGFQQAVEALRDRFTTAIVEVSGPWPAYHFTDVDVSGARLATALERTTESIVRRDVPT